MRCNIIGAEIKFTVIESDAGILYVTVINDLCYSTP